VDAQRTRAPVPAGAGGTTEGAGRQPRRTERGRNGAAALEAYLVTTSLPFIMAEWPGKVQKKL